jgi:hypothetical protein
MNWDDENTVDELPMPPRGPGLSAADMELLTLAARAIGARAEAVEGENWMSLYFDDGSHVWSWNPLLHSDDAFNLAIDLGFQVFPVARTMSGQACAAVASPVGARLAEEVSTLDARAATRRAVTRAAAEIGRAMA